KAVEGQEVLLGFSYDYLLHKNFPIYLGRCDEGDCSLALHTVYASSVDDRSDYLYIGINDFENWFDRVEGQMVSFAVVMGNLGGVRFWPIGEMTNFGEEDWELFSESAFPFMEDECSGSVRVSNNLRSLYEAAKEGGEVWDMQVSEVFPELGKQEQKELQELVLSGGGGDGKDLARVVYKLHELGVAFFPENLGLHIAGPVND
ncbi:MAG: hypothetical protein U9Q82_06905, partial [Chloroflexota bacterium]|nr:hypothetical protein [Chloroflexota bacterium]